MIFLSYPMSLGISVWTEGIVFRAHGEILGVRISVDCLRYLGITDGFVVLRLRSRAY